MKKVSDEWIEKAIDFLLSVYADKDEEKETFEAKIILALRELQERRKKEYETFVGGQDDENNQSEF